LREILITCLVEIREQVLFAVAQNDDEEESLEWLIGIAKDKDEAMELRTRAIFWAGQMGDLPVDALGSLYEDAEDREMKEQVLFGIAQQDSKEAVTLLMEIARNEDDVALKTNIIFWIGQSDDSRVPSFLEEIITR
jgi:HEAT repeat protein